MLFEQRKVSSQLQGFWQSFYNFKKNNNTRVGKKHWIAFHRQEKKGILLSKKKNLVGVALLSLQLCFWLRCSGKTLHMKKSQVSVWRACALQAVYTGTHSPGCSRTAESRHSGKHRSYDLPSPSFHSSSSPSPLNSNTSCKQACS